MNKVLHCSLGRQAMFELLEYEGFIKIGHIVQNLIILVLVRIFTSFSGRMGMRGNRLQFVESNELHSAAGTDVVLFEVMQIIHHGVINHHRIHEIKRHRFSFRNLIKFLFDSEIVGKDRRVSDTENIALGFLINHHASPEKRLQGNSTAHVNDCFQDHTGPDANEKILAQSKDDCHEEDRELLRSNLEHVGEFLGMSQLDTHGNQHGGESGIRN